MMLSVAPVKNVAFAEVAVELPFIERRRRRSPREILRLFAPENPPARR